MSTDSSMTLKQAATQVLQQSAPMHYRELVDCILEQGLASSSSKTPHLSLNAILAVDIKQNGDKSEFIRTRPGVFGLRSLHGTPTVSEPNPRTIEGLNDGFDEERRVRNPLFPSYSEVRALLRIWPGWRRSDVTGLNAKVTSLSGTPQNTVDWTDPDTWIVERLSGDKSGELASAIWEDSGKTVNPRHTHGHWLLSQTYRLIQVTQDELITLSNRGEDFLLEDGGDAEEFIDEQEGIVKLLTMVADNGSARPRELLDDWSKYLLQYSTFGSRSTFQDTMRRRLANLLDREMLSRSSAMYSITDQGLAYLGRFATEVALGGDDQQHIRKLVKNQESSVRETLLEILLEMDPFVFEHLVKRLLEEMEYQNVEVTSPSGDGGVDVVADIELGISSVREVVQVKRHKTNIPRKDLDALRGSLYRFGAVRGTIITTSDFTKGTKDEAFATGAAPITLIDGQKLIDLLIEHGIGVRKHEFEILDVDLDAFSDLNQVG